MKKTIYPSTVAGTVTAPPSKSHAQRAVVASSLAKGTSEIIQPGKSEDVISCINLAQNFGTTFRKTDEKLFVSGAFKYPENPLNCGESGFSFRVYSCLACLFDREITLTGEKTLLERPVSSLEKTLKELNITFSSTGGFPPVTIKGPLKHGTYKINGSHGSQVVSGLLFAFPLLAGETRLLIDDLKSTPYIDLTLEVLKNCGIHIENNQYSEFIIPGNQHYLPFLHKIEGDWSGAAFLLVAGAINGEVFVSNLNPVSTQADRSILMVLELAGAKLIIEKTGIRVIKNELRPFRFDATDCPDLFPPLVALAAHCKGKTIIKGASRLITKESNRALALKNEFGKMGVVIENSGDFMSIEGSGILPSGVDSHGDHRIAMACAVTALAGKGPVEIENAGVVNKSYPDFFEDLNSITLKKIT